VSFFCFKGLVGNKVLKIDLLCFMIFYSMSLLLNINFSLYSVCVRNRHEHYNEAVVLNPINI
jgi:hypothetical protein